MDAGEGDGGAGRAGCTHGCNLHKNQGRVDFADSGIAGVRDPQGMDWGGGECVGHRLKRGATLTNPAEQLERAADKGAPGTERRRSKRYACEGFAEALVFHPETLVRGEIRDISESGCYLMTRAHLKMERAAEVELRFTLHGNHYRMNARVTDVRPGRGMGLEFAAGDAKVEAALKGLIAAMSG